MSEETKDQRESLILEGKVDSRLKGYFGNVTHPTLNMERTFCVMCHKPKGYVTTECSEYAKVKHAVFICDDCDERYAPPPEMRKLDISGLSNFQKD